MSNGDDIIICGTGGTPVTDKTITIYDAPFSVAIKIDRHELEVQAIAAGMNPQEAHKRVERLARMVEADWDNWGDFIEDRLGLPYTRHTPHSQP